MKKARKLTAIIMAAVLMLSMMPVNVFADQAQLDIYRDAAVTGATAVALAAVTDGASVAAVLNPLMANATVYDHTGITVRVPAHGTSANPFGTAGSVTGTFIAQYRATTYRATGVLDVVLPANLYTPEDDAAAVASARAWLGSATVTNSLRAYAATAASVDALLTYINTEVLTGPLAGVVATQGTGAAALVITAPTALEPGSVTGVLTLTQADATATFVVDLSIFVVGGPIIGEGSVVYIDTTVWDVVLPTSLAFDFVLDPLGLLGPNTLIATGTNPPSVPAGVVVMQDAGRILPASAAGTVLNLSSNYIALTVEYQGVGDASFMGEGTLAGLVARDASPRNTPAILSTLTETSVNHHGSGNRVAMWLVPNATAIESLVAVTDRPSGAPNLTVPVFDHDAAALGFLVDDDEANTITFFLPSANYRIVHESGLRFVYELVEDNVGVGQMFQVGGLVNENASWASFMLGGDDEISIRTVFSWAAAPGNREAAQEGANPATGYQVTGVAYLRANQANPAASNLPNHVVLSGGSSPDPQVYARAALEIPEALREALANTFTTPVGTPVLLPVPTGVVVGGVRLTGGTQNNQLWTYATSAWMVRNNAAGTLSLSLVPANTTFTVVLTDAAGVPLVGQPIFTVRVTS